MIKTAGELLAAGALRTKVVEVCGTQVTIRELSVRQRAGLSKVEKERAAAYIVQQAVIGQDGQALFADTALDQLESLRPELVDGIAAAVMRMSVPETTEGKD